MDAALISSKTAFRLTLLADTRSPATRPYDRCQETQQVKSAEEFMGLVNVPQGTEKFVLMQDMRYRIDRPNQRSVAFVTPRYADPVQEEDDCDHV